MIAAGIGAAWAVAVAVALRPGSPWAPPARRPTPTAPVDPPTRRWRPTPRLRRTLLVGGGVLAAVVDPLAAATIGALVLVRRRWRRVRAHRPVEAGLRRSLPDLCDLLRLCVGAGMTLRGSLGLLARWGPEATAPALRSLQRAVERGRPLTDAIAELDHAWGDPGRPLGRALADHARYGTALEPALERVAVELRGQRRRAGEAAARRLPVLLLFPLVFCTLPAFGLLTVAPIVVGTLRSLEGTAIEAPASEPELELRGQPCTDASWPPTWPPCP